MSQSQVIIMKKKKKSGARIRDKRHACLFCVKLLVNIARHYRLVHKNETKVVWLLSIPKGSNRRKDAFNELNRQADFNHNCVVLNLKKGELILVRHPSRKKEVSRDLIKYGLCPNGYGIHVEKNNLAPFKIQLWS